MVSEFHNGLEIPNIDPCSTKYSNTTSAQVNLMNTHYPSHISRPSRQCNCTLSAQTGFTTTARFIETHYSLSTQLNKTVNTTSKCAVRLDIAGEYKGTFFPTVFPLKCLNCMCFYVLNRCPCIKGLKSLNSFRNTWSIW